MQLLPFFLNFFWELCYFQIFYLTIFLSDPLQNHETVLLSIFGGFTIYLLPQLSSEVRLLEIVKKFELLNANRLQYHTCWCASIFVYVHKMYFTLWLSTSVQVQILHVVATNCVLTWYTCLFPVIEYNFWVYVNSLRCNTTLSVLNAPLNANQLHIRSAVLLLVLWPGLLTTQEWLQLSIEWNYTRMLMLMCVACCPFQYWRGLSTVCWWTPTFKTQLARK